MDRNVSEVPQNELSNPEAANAPTHMNNDTDGRSAGVGGEAATEVTASGEGRDPAKGKASRKGKAKSRKKAKAAKAARPSYKDLGIEDPEHIQLLDNSVEEWDETDKTTAELVFIRARIVGKCAHVFTSQKQKEAWSQAYLKITRRHAETHGKIYDELMHLAERMITARVTPSVIFELPGAPMEKIEAVLERFEAGDKPTVQDVKNFLKRDGDETTALGEDVELSGADGIRKMVKEKVKDTVPRIIEGHEILLAACLGALDDHNRGVNVKKGELEAKVSHLAWVVHAMLENLSFNISPRSERKPWAVNVARPEPETGWAQVVKQLALLSDGVKWPNPIGPWLINEVIPALEWGLGPKLAKAVRDADERRLADIATSKVTAKAAAKAAAKKAAKAERAAAKPTKAKAAKSTSASTEVPVSAASVEPAAPAEPAATIEPVAPIEPTEPVEPTAPAERRKEVKFVVPAFLKKKEPVAEPSSEAAKDPKPAKAKRPLRPTLNDGLVVIAKAGGFTT